jgi:hypothetical protein
MTRAVYLMMHLQFASAISYNIVVVLFPLYLASDMTTLFYQQKRLVLIKKIILASIFGALLILYVFRIWNHFN